MIHAMPKLIGHLVAGFAFVCTLASVSTSASALTLRFLDTSENPTLVADGPLDPDKQKITNFPADETSIYTDSTVTITEDFLGYAVLREEGFSLADCRANRERCVSDYVKAESVPIGGGGRLLKLTFVSDREGSLPSGLPADFPGRDTVNLWDQETAGGNKITTFIRPPPSGATFGLPAGSPTVIVASVPEPGTMILLATGLLSIVILRLISKNQKTAG